MDLSFGQSSFILSACVFISYLVSGSANQEHPGPVAINGCEVGTPISTAEYMMPIGKMHNSAVVADRSLTRSRRSFGYYPKSFPWTKNRLTTGKSGQVDPSTYLRLARNFMRFGRRVKPCRDGNEGINCLPVEEMDSTSSSASGQGLGAAADKEKGKLGSSTNEEQRFARSERDQVQYDYNGKPFMRFGKRFMRFGKSGGEEVPGEEEDSDEFLPGNVVGKDADRNSVRFGKVLDMDPLEVAASAGEEMAMGSRIKTENM